MKFTINQFNSLVDITSRSYVRI